MRVPDDVTLLFSDDNWGNIRRLPAAADRNRPGGFGVYYHFDYVGGPRNYKWINTEPDRRACGSRCTSRTSRGRIASGSSTSATSSRWSSRSSSSSTTRGIRRACRPSACPRTRASGPSSSSARSTRRRSRRSSRATSMYAGRRKPELLAPETYSLANYGEAERIVADYDSLVQRARRRSATQLPADRARRSTSSSSIRCSAAANLNAMYVAHGEEPALRTAGARVDEPAGRQRARAVRARRGDLALPTITSSPAASGPT